MKKLMILIIIMRCIVVNSQIESHPEFVFWVDIDTVVTKEWITDTVSEVVDIIDNYYVMGYKWGLGDGDALKNIVNWKNYKEECYNDSTATTKHIIPDSDRACYMTLMWPPEANYCVDPNHKDTVEYIHKQPTFEGFMDYLEKKEKENGHKLIKIEYPR